MKRLISIAFLFFCLNSFATNYYLNTATGNDANAGTFVAPWKTINKINTFFNSFNNGDSVLFARGQIFYGKIRPTKSFTTPLVFSAYGSGAQPVISSFIQLDSWTNLGGNIWEGVSSDSSAFVTLNNTNEVVINGVNVAMGRFPNDNAANGGYLTYQTFTQTKLTSSSLNSAVTNWTGAIAVIRKNNWIIEKDTITSASGSSINHTFHGTNNGTNNYGFFIENDARTLDAQNEWYFVPATRKLRIFSTSMPTDVKIATIDTLVWTHNFDVMTFKNLTFTGSNTNTFVVPGSNHIIIRNCTFDFSGRDVIWGYQNVGAASASNFSFDSNTVNHTNNNVVQVAQEFTNSSFSFNTVKNTGLQVGMLANGATTQSNAKSAQVFSISSANCMIQRNIIDSTGYVSIYWLAGFDTIRYNLITEAMRTKQDGGLIYTWNGIPGATSFTGQKIYNNILLNSSGLSSIAGTTQAVTSSLVHGVYLDANTRNVEVYNNTCANLGWGGGYSYSGSSNNNWHNNTFYNNVVNQMRLIDQRPASNGSIPSTNDTIKNNIFFSRTATQFTGVYTTAVTPATFFGAVGIFDSNYYARPIDDNLTIQFVTGSTTSTYNLAQWKTVSGKDAASNKSPITITNVNQLYFVYNDSAIVTNKFLPAGIYKDVRNVSYSGSITLQPFSSAVLINTGAVNVAPTVNAGIDQTIQLPTSTINLVGTASDADGTISSVLWTRISGSGIITSPTSLSTTITGLTGGVSQFKLTATDNLGAQGSDIMQVTVNPANVSPTANAGTDQAIQLPTSTTTLIGSGNDPDGSITGYLWTKVSGPAGGTITSPTSATTGITALGAGTYVFNLQVTDNQSATGNDQISIIVSAAANIAPTANAGIDQTIQLPVTSANLVGSGSDPDGTIVSYAWTQISGPTATITSPSTASTSITGMSTANTYQFKLTVTDNGGLTGSDNIVITVTPANVQPLVNAGIDQSITLPVSSITLSGSATDPDGTISSHNWTKTSGTGGAITSASSYSTTVTGLTQGTYVFRLTATDNQSLIGFDEMTVIVNPAINILPDVSVSPNQVLTWPTNFTTISASASDSDGTIAAYQWIKVRGGVGTIVNPTSATTSITGLDLGLYFFQIQVTDNSGASVLDTVQIQVNKGTATISVTGTSVVYNTFQQGVTVSTTPSGLATSTTYNGITTQPIDVNTYNFITAGTDPHYTYNTVTGVFSITKATAILSATSQSFFFDGLPHIITASINPSTATGITYSYSSGTAPVNVGVYGDTIKLVNSNYQATPVIVQITILSNSASIFISDTVHTFNGSPQGVTVTCPYAFVVAGSPQTNVGQYQVIAHITDGIHTGADTATLIILKKKGHVTLAKPANVAYGTVFTSVQLQASSDIPGTITFVPTYNDPVPLNTSTITATLAPTDPANYDGDAATTTITSFPTTPFVNFYLTNHWFKKL